MSEAWKLSSQNVPRSGTVVVQDIDGQQVRIERFRFIDVHATKCSSVLGDENPRSTYCYTDKVRFVAPVRLEVADGTLWVTPNLDDRRHTSQSRFDEVERVTIADRSFQRTLIIVGAACAAGVATFLATSLAVSKVDGDDPHGLRALVIGMYAGHSAAGLSLLITFPLTRDLGDVID